jgi:hypothetical protein
MNKVSTQAQVKHLAREDAIYLAAFHLASVREKVEALNRWLEAGDADGHHLPYLAEAILEGFHCAYAMAWAFSLGLQGVDAFMEEARLEAARILRERGANQPRPAGEEEVPF